MYSVTKEQSLFGTAENETNPHGSTCGEMDSTENTRNEETMQQQCVITQKQFALLHKVKCKRLKHSIGIK